MTKATTTAAALAIGLAIAAALAVGAWRIGAADFGAGLGPVGSLHSVLLTNNQVYYGELEKAGPSYVVLSHVFYVQAVTDPNSNERMSKLVERAANDWHAPSSMTIPIDKIVFAEIVGPESHVAKLIAP